VVLMAQGHSATPVVFTMPSLNVNAKWNSVPFDPKQAMIAHDLAGHKASTASRSRGMPAASRECIEKGSNSSSASAQQAPVSTSILMSANGSLLGATFSSHTHHYVDNCLIHGPISMEHHRRLLFSYFFSLRSWFQGSCIYPPFPRLTIELRRGTSLSRVLLGCILFGVMERLLEHGS